jgi:tetratricopeptide (TPR) repeat protein
MRTAPILCSVSLMLISLWMQTAAAHTDIETQLASVTQELESRPNDYSLYLVRGELKRHSQDWLGAEADFARADELGSAEIRDQLKLYRGRLFQEAGQARRAVAETDTYIARHSEHIEALRVRALAYAQMGEFNEAIADYTRLIELDTTQSPELWLERARLWLRAGCTDAAITSIDDATVTIGPLVTFVEFAVNAEIGRHNYAAALDHMEKLPSVLVETPEWLWHRGNLLEQLERPDEAALVYAQAQKTILKMPLRRQKTAAMQDLLARLRVL